MKRQSLNQRIGLKSSGGRFGIYIFKQRQPDLLNQRILISVNFGKFKVARKAIFNRRLHHKIRFEQNAQIIQSFIPNRAHRLSRRRNAHISRAAFRNNFIAAGGRFFRRQIAGNRDVYFMKIIRRFEQSARQILSAMNFYAVPRGLLNK